MVPETCSIVKPSNGFEKKKTAVRKCEKKKLLLFCELTFKLFYELLGNIVVILAKLRFQLNLVKRTKNFSEN